MESERLELYRRGLEPLPAWQLVWPLYGAGFENLGQGGRPIRAARPTCGPDEILVRHDAVGLCFSDLKVIRAGQSHPRVYDDMRSKPVILGHEIALTVVAVGANRRGTFQVGQRHGVQPDVFYKGRSLAMGYALPGGLQQYNVLGPEILDGDEGCYLLPLEPRQGYAEAALAEPWACVEAAYRIEYRRGPKPTGVAWLAGVPGAGRYQLGRWLEGGHPRAIVLTGVPASLERALRAQAAALGISLIEAHGLAPDAYPQAAAAAGVAAFDDVILLGPHGARSIAAAMALTAAGGALILASAEPLPEPAAVDVGRLHYDRILLGGTAGPDVAAGYRPPACELKAGGVLWVIGGAGPMGHMHIQRALQLESGRPRRVIVSDLLAPRLAVVRRKFGPLARRNDVDLVTLVEPELSREAFQARMSELTDGRGPDDIVVLAPVADVVARAFGFLAPGGTLNIFAGLNRGTLATLDLNGVRDERQLRLCGSSGSTIADLRYVLAKSLAGTLATGQAVAAVSGLEGALAGLQGMAAQRFTGKVVIYPQAVDLPLTTLEEMPRTMPTVAARLGEGPVWTNEAEEELLRCYVARDG